MNAGLWRLLRTLRFSARERTVRCPPNNNLSITHDAADELWPLRGHQYTCAHHASMFRSWEEMLDFTLALAAFGTNQVEMAHISPDATGAPARLRAHSWLS